MQTPPCEARTGVLDGRARSPGPVHAALGQATVSRGAGGSRGQRGAAGGGARLRREDGFTLIELLVAMSLGLIIVTATLALFITSQKDEQGLFSRADTVQLANEGLRQMDQDLRQAYEINYPLSSTTSNGCTASSGTQPCNIIDVLTRLTGTDYEVRYDCTVTSTTVSGDKSCWRYECSASASTTTTSSCTASSSTLLSSREVIDDVSNPSTTPVFSLCYTSTLTTGSACTSSGTATSATVTIDTPAAGTLSSSAGGDRSTVVLTDGIYMPDLSYGQ